MVSECGSYLTTTVFVSFSLSVAKVQRMSEEYKQHGGKFFMFFIPNISAMREKIHITGPVSRYLIQIKADDMLHGLNKSK